MRRCVRTLRAIAGESGDYGTPPSKARVQRILVEDGRAVGVRLTEGEELRAPVVVSNADIKRTYLELVGREHLPARLRRKVEGYRMALPLFSLYLAVDFDVRNRLPARVPVFMTSGTLKDPEGQHTAPPGHPTLELMTIAPADHGTWGVGEGPATGERYSRGPSYLTTKEQLAEAVLDTASTVIPGWDPLVAAKPGSPIRRTPRRGGRTPAG